MKTILLTIIALAITLTSFGQAPEAFKYQAVVRDGGGLILTNQSVGYQLTILQGSPSGTAVYTETFSPTTNGYGLVNLEIGTGTTTDDFSIIDWANGPFFMETAVDITGGTSYTVMGTSQLMSVPYALYAKTSGSSTPGPQGIQGPAGNDGTNGNDGVQGIQGPAGNDGTNGNDGAQGIQGPAGNDGVGIAQTLSQTGSDVTLSDGGGTVSVNDADSDPTNELQALSLSNDTLYLSNGNDVFLGDLSFSSTGGNTSGFLIINTNTSFIVPANVDKIIVEVWGAGGAGGTGGGGASPDGSRGGSGGGGGGSGGYSKNLLDVTPGQTFLVTIGVGGTVAEQDGTLSSFGAISCTGGTGGITGLAGLNSVAVLGGVGGIGGTPNGVDGGTGGNGSSSQWTSGAGGIGGFRIYDLWGDTPVWTPGVTGSGGLDGNPGIGSMNSFGIGGSAGSGGTTYGGLGGAAGVGGNGLVIIHW